MLDGRTRTSHGGEGAFARSFQHVCFAESAITEVVVGDEDVFCTGWQRNAPKYGDGRSACMRSSLCVYLAARMAIGALADGTIIAATLNIVCAAKTTTSTEAVEDEDGAQTSKGDGGGTEERGKRQRAREFLGRALRLVQK